MFLKNAPTCVSPTAVANVEIAPVCNQETEAALTVSIQSCLVHTSRALDKDRSIAGSFVRMMGVGNVKAALKLTTEKENSGSPPLDSLHPDVQIVKEHLLE